MLKLTKKIGVMALVFSLIGCSDESANNKNVDVAQQQNQQQNAQLNQNKEHATNQRVGEKELTKQGEADNGKANEEGKNLQASNKEQLRVGLSACYPPFESVVDGEIVGFDIDLINEIGKVLNKEIVINDMPFYSLIAALENNKIDVAISAMSSTPNRLENADFSIPYYLPKIGIIYRKDLPEEKRKIVEGVRLSAQSGSVMAEFGNKAIEGMKDTSLVIMDTHGQLIASLLQGRTDMVIIENIEGLAFVRENEQLEYKDLETQYDHTTGGYAIVTPKGSSLSMEINKVLYDFENNGTLNQLKRKWNLF